MKKINRKRRNIVLGSVGVGVLALAGMSYLFGLDYQQLFVLEILGGIAVGFFTLSYIHGGHDK